MFMHGIEEFDIIRDDTLANPGFIEYDELKKFNVILANPPYSIKRWDQKSFENDPYGRNIWGTPPKGCADYAFQQHIHKSMNTANGRCAILWPHGILQRISEKNMRINLIKTGSVEAVLGLGPNLFYNSAMDSCILVCNNKKSNERVGKIIFIDAYKLVTRSGTDSFLEEQQIQQIYKTYQNFKNEESFSKIVSEEDILKNNGSLKITDYLKRPTLGERDLDFTAAYDNWAVSNNQLKESMERLL